MPIRFLAWIPQKGPGGLEPRTWINTAPSGRSDGTGRRGRTLVHCRAREELGRWQLGYPAAGSSRLVAREFASPVREPGRDRILGNATCAFNDWKYNDVRSRLQTQLASTRKFELRLSPGNDCSIHDSQSVAARFVVSRHLRVDTDRSALIRSWSGMQWLGGHQLMPRSLGTPHTRYLGTVLRTYLPPSFNFELERIAGVFNFKFSTFVQEVRR